MHGWDSEMAVSALQTWGEWGEGSGREGKEVELSTRGCGRDNNPTGRELVLFCGWWTPGRKNKVHKKVKKKKRREWPGQAV